MKTATVALQALMMNNVVLEFNPRTSNRLRQGTMLIVILGKVRKHSNTKLLGRRRFPMIGRGS